MQATQIKSRVERTPFRPFSIRLTNGAEYEFREARDFGAPRDFHVIIYFGADTDESGYVEIDPEKITEIFELK